MTTALIVITDGRRDLLTETIESARENLLGNIGYRLLWDDTGDPQHNRWATNAFPDFDVVCAPSRSGFGGAIAATWATLLEQAPDDVDMVFHLEDDFTFNKPVHLELVRAVMDANRHLAQMAFRRQPWSAPEIAAGGFIEMHPLEYRDQVHYEGDLVCPFLQHRLFFTTNPSMYRLDLCRRGWPDGDHSEGEFSRRLFTNPTTWCGYWGSRDSEPWVHHNGKERHGVGY